MGEIVHAIASGVRLSIFFGCTAAIFTAVMVTVCRWMKWAPVNITINNYHGTPDDVGPQQKPQESKSE